MRERPLSVAAGGAPVLMVTRVGVPAVRVLALVRLNMKALSESFMNPTADDLGSRLQDEGRRAHLGLRWLAWARAGNRIRHCVGQLRRGTAGLQPDEQPVRARPDVARDASRMRLAQAFSTSSRDEAQREPERPVGFDPVPRPPLNLIRWRSFGTTARRRSTRRRLTSGPNPWPARSPTGAHAKARDATQSHDCASRGGKIARSWGPTRTGASPEGAMHLHRARRHHLLIYRLHRRIIDGPGGTSHTTGTAAREPSPGRRPGERT